MMPWPWVIIVLFCVSAAAPPSAAPQPEHLVGLRKQLFVDDAVVEKRERVTRELGSITKANNGKPIFTDGRLYGTVLRDDKVFKLWYRKLEVAEYGYAESIDGEHFQHRGDVAGINFAGDSTLSVTIDEHEQDPAHRYKAAYDGPGMAAALAHSADGLRWTSYNKGQAVTTRAADTCNQILWDPIAQVYRLFTRTDFGDGGGPREIRGTRSMTNPDVKANPIGWKTVRNWSFDREGGEEYKRRQIYSVTDWIYEGVHFGLMSVYEWPGDTSEGTENFQVRHERDIMNFYIATSRDGDTWDLAWVYKGHPLIKRGGDGSFDKDILVPASTVVTHSDQHWLYYCGANERHGTAEMHFNRSMAIGLAKVRLDGLICLSAGATLGSVTTKSFELQGSRLEVNVDARQGECHVEILDADNIPIQGFAAEDVINAANVDGVRLSPRWKPGVALTELKGRMIRLRFRLRNAKLYAFQIAP
jgi:hypothetical protein